MSAAPFLHFDGMTWPNPAALNDVAYRLAWDKTPSRGDLMMACSAIRAYAQLVEEPQRRRNAKIAGIRAASASEREEGSNR